MMDRRDFLKLAGMGAAGAMLPSYAFAQQRPMFGISSDILFRSYGGETGPGIVPVHQMRTLKEHGIDAIRIATFWRFVQPQESFLTPESMTEGLRHLDMQVDYAHRAGIDVTLNITTAPSWSTAGKPTLEGTCMTPPRYGDYDATRPGCEYPLGSFPTQQYVDLVQFLVRRYKGVVKSMEGWNEPQYSIFWPYRDAQGVHPDRKYLIEAVQVPLYNAVKSADPDVKVVGPVETHQDYLRENLLAERQYGRLFDIISIHEYGVPWWKPDERYPDTIFYRLDNWFKPVIDELGDGRELWMTESSIVAYDEPGETVLSDLQTAMDQAYSTASKEYHNPAYTTEQQRFEAWKRYMDIGDGLRAQLGAIRGPKRVQMADEFMGRFLARVNDPSALQVDRIYLHQFRSHPSVDPWCVGKSPDVEPLLHCDGTPTPVLQRMKQWLHPPRRRSVRK